MRRMATAFFLALCAFLAAGPPSARAQQLLYDYVGFDFEFPDPDGTLFGEVGSGYNGVGEVPNLFPPLLVDPANNYYTYYITGMTSISRFVFGDFVVVNYGPGTLRLYEDSRATGTAPVYGVNPPNATSPGTFNDGILILEGVLTNFQLILNTVTQSGSYEAEFDVTGGTQFPIIPSDQRMGWTFAGVTGNSTTTPTGYAHQVDGQVFLQEPTPARPTSWGTIKARYR